MQERSLRLLGLRHGPLALASRSPRRRELLERMELPLLFIDVEVDEGNRAAQETPEDYVQRLAGTKLEASLDAAGRAQAYVCVAADTVVELDGDVLEKPEDVAHAEALLARLAGRWHRVFTGVALVRLGDRRRVVGVECTEVRFGELAAMTRRDYVATGEPLDKAGAYGIQGWGGLFVPEIRGDYFNVMGLPLARLRALCLELEDGPLV